MQKNRIPERCLPCKNLHTGGKKNNVYNRWCCKFSNAASKVQAQCIASDGFNPKDECKK